MESAKETNHNEGYAVYAKTAIVLMFFTALNIFIAGSVHDKIGAGLIIVIAAIQAFIALTWFMHLKFDNLLFKMLVMGVFLLYAIVIVITFFDYLFR